MEQQKKTSPLTYIMILISLIFLFNPSISVIDILPDFVAYFIFARILLRPSDRAPYFEEARIAFRRLGWINVLKLVGFLAIITVRRQNSTDNDVIALVTISFAAVEAIFSVIAVKNLFNGLYYLGERTDAVSTVRPFKLIASLRMSPESLSVFTHFFAVSRCVLYFLPTMFLLRKINDAGTGVVLVSPKFPAVFFACLALSALIGVVFVFLFSEYVSAIHKEGKFLSAIEFLTKDSGDAVSTKEKVRKINFALTTFAVAALFTIELSLVESYDVNLLPRFIYAAVMLFALLKISPFAKATMPALCSGAVYFISSVIAYFFETRFLISYGYEALRTNAAARDSYKFVNISAAIEFAALVIFLIFVFKVLSSFARLNTKLIDVNERMRGDDAYFGRLNLKNALVLASGILAGAVKCLSVFLHGAVKIVYTDPNDISRPIVIAPAVEWIGLAVFVSAALYIGCTIYCISTLKDEIKLKHE